MPEYTVYLSGKSFRETAKKIRAYRDKLAAKIEIFCMELAKEGERVIRADIATHDRGGGETLGSVEIVSEGGNGTYVAKVQVTSDAILFIEFGSGINHQAISAPHAAQFGMGVGTFGRANRQNPDYENWANPDGWHYYDEAGKLHWSDGMYPTYPMYKGGQEMRRKLQEVAKRVFGNA